MNLFRMEVFIAVAETQSFTRAAEKMFITQPAVTRNIQDIEREMSRQLIERKGNKIRLTEAGELFYRYAQKILQEYNYLRLELGRDADRSNGVFRIGSGASLTRYLLDDIIIRLHSQFPELKFTVINKNSLEVERMLLDHELDIGIVSSLTQQQGLKYLPYLNDEIILVAAHDHPLGGRRKGVPLQEAMQYSFCIRETGSGTRDAVDRFLKGQGMIEPLSVALETSNETLLRHFVLHSNSLAFVSAPTVAEDLKTRRMQQIRLQEGPVIRQTYIAYVSGHTLHPVMKPLLRTLALHQQG